MSDGKDFSPTLRAAMHEVAAVLKKHDVGGFVVLGDGEGLSEYRLFIDTPGWSNIRFVKGGGAIHFKAHSKSKPIETGKTVNLIYNLQDVVARNFMVLDKVKDMIKQHLKVEETKGRDFHGPYNDGKDT